MAELAPESDPAFLLGLLKAFADWVFDLPASQRHHHARPFGLYEHSLEVAVSAVQDLAQRWKENQCSRFIEAPMLAEMAWTTFAVGLFHDCGKILDADVGLDSQGAPWNPLEEPLIRFTERQSGRTPGPTRVQLRLGRGVRDHNAGGFRLAHRILGCQFDAQLPWALFSTVYFTYLNRYDRSRWLAPTRVAYVADLVHQADQRSTGSDRWKLKGNRGRGAGASPEGR